MQTHSMIPISFGSIYKYNKEGSTIYGEAKTGMKAYDFYGNVNGRKLEVTFEPPYDIPGMELYKASAQLSPEGNIDIETYSLFGKQRLASTMFIKDVVDLVKKAFGLNDTYKESSRNVYTNSDTPTTHTSFIIDA